MGPNDPNSRQGGEDTTDWPVSQPPPTPGGAARPSRADIEPNDQEATLEAAKFTRPPHQPPVPPTAPPQWPSARPPSGPPAGQPPSWGQQGAYPPHSAAPSGTHPPYSPGPGPYPPPHPGYQQPPVAAPPVVPKPKNSVFADRRWWVVGGAAILAVVVGVVLVTANGGDDADTAGEQPSTTAAQVPAGPVTTVPGEPSAAPAPPPPPPPPGPIVAADALPGFLLSAEQVGQRFNTAGMTTTAVGNKPLLGTITPAPCAGPWGPAHESTYAGSGFTGLAVQVLSQEPALNVAQAVAAFPDPAAAKGFFDKQSADWSSCQSSHVVWSYNGDTVEVDVGVPAMVGDVMTVRLMATNSRTPGQQCERAMTLRGNVIVDVRACSPTVGSGGQAIANDIAVKIR